MADWNSLLTALNSAAVGAFGRELLYQPVAGEHVVIQGIFEANREPQDAAPGVYGAVFLRASALAAPPERGDRIVVDDKAYTIFDIEADHGGGLVLRLRRI